MIRRFKKDVREQVKKSFRDRTIFAESFPHSAVEETANEALLAVRVRGQASGGKRQLFSVTLEKALFSSPRRLPGNRGGTPKAPGASACR